MARVEIAAQPWGVVQDRAGNARAAVPFTLTTTAGGAVVRYTTATGSTPEPSTVTNDNGEIPGFVDAGTYTITISGVVRRVEAVSSAGTGGEVYAEDFGAAGDGTTDDASSLQSTLNALGAAGDTLRLKHNKTYLYTTPLAASPHARIRGAGRGTVLKGPGLTCLAALNTYVDGDLYVADLTLDGQGYTATGRGFDLLGASMVTFERVKFVGFQDQAVADYCQRVRFVDCEFVASTGTRSGVWTPYGADAHAGVDPATGTTNIVEYVNCHWNFTNAPGGFPVADDGGLQHTFVNCQASGGASSVRLGRPSGVSFEACDFEFMSGATILTAATSLTGTALGGKVAALTVGPGNYFGGQVDLANVDVLVDFGNDFHIPNLPVYKNCTSAQAIFSLGSGNVSTGGTMFDGNPVGNMLTYDRTGIATLRNTLLAFGFRANGAGALTNPQLWVSSLPASINFGSNYGFGVDPNGVAVAWGIADKGRVYTTAGRPSAATAGAGARVYDSTLSKPVWSDGTNWRDATGTIV